MRAVIVSTHNVKFSRSRGVIVHSCSASVVQIGRSRCGDEITKVHCSGHTSLICVIQEHLTSRCPDKESMSRKLTSSGEASASASAAFS